MIPGPVVQALYSRTSRNFWKPTKLLLYFVDIGYIYALISGAPVTINDIDGLTGQLFQQGAKLVQNIEDIVEELPPLYRSVLPSKKEAGQNTAPSNAGRLTPDEAAVAALLDETEPIHLDRLAETAPFGIGRLQAALFGLELEGAVEQTPGRYYVLRPLKER